MTETTTLRQDDPRLLDNATAQRLRILDFQTRLPGAIQQNAEASA
jgi:hypothetical protein